MELNLMEINYQNVKNIDRFDAGTMNVITGREFQKNNRSILRMLKLSNCIKCGIKEFLCIYYNKTLDRYILILQYLKKIHAKPKTSRSYTIL